MYLGTYLGLGIFVFCGGMMPRHVVIDSALQRGNRKRENRRPFFGFNIKGVNFLPPANAHLKMSRLFCPRISVFGRSVRGQLLQSRLYQSSQWHRSINSAASPSSPAAVIFSGIQPTGVPHLGNYLGALHEWVKLQNNATPETTLLFSIVDLHALTVPQDAAQLRKWKKEAFATLLAVGLDPKRSTIFFQSDVRNQNPHLDTDPTG